MRRARRSPTVSFQSATHNTSAKCLTWKGDSFPEAIRSPLTPSQMRIGALILSVVTLVVTGCGLLVRQQDLDAWVGMPVEALDTHSFFLTVPMVRTRTESGLEIRNYANMREIADCVSAGSARSRGQFVSGTEFSTCSSMRTGCNNLFYIRDGKVLEYVPRGQCRTSEMVQPEARYRRLAP